MNINPDNAAFPNVAGQKLGEEPGLSIRTYLAAMAMQGMFANPNPSDASAIVKWSVEAADMLINELNK